jgi:hypothetical protein
MTYGNTLSARRRPLADDAVEERRLTVMIPIECPRCGRRGEFSPDRLNSRLNCTACDAIIQLDRAGRLAVVDPAEAQGPQVLSAKAVAFDFAWREVWDAVPGPLKLGFPLLVLFALLLGRMMPGYRPPGFIKQAEVIVRGLATNDRERVVALAIIDSAEAAGEWFDLIRTRLEGAHLGQDVFINVTLFAGDADKDRAVTVVGMLLTSGPDTGPPEPSFFRLRREAARRP